MAKMKRNYEVEKAFENIENSDSLRKRKGVFRRLMEAVKLLSENDGEVESVDENEVKIFNENLALIAGVEKNNYKDSLQYNSLQKNKEPAEKNKTHSNYNERETTKVRDNDIGDIQK